MNLINKFLNERIAENDFPSAVYLVAEKDKIVLQDALGFAVVEPKKIEVKIETIYDLASLTKPLVTGLLCAKSLEQNLFNLSDKINKYYPNFNAEITIENLLTHTSGLPAWKPFYLLCDSRDAICDLIILESKNAKPNQTVVYSDLNFILLGFCSKNFTKKDSMKLQKLKYLSH